MCSPDGQSWNLVDDSKDHVHEVVLLNAGGQEGDFPLRQVIDQLQTLQAAQTFLRTGELDAFLNWEQQED
ncbi:Imm1 family immunity protein [Roseateles sp. L2-2]|uniref:Imm1 family immunity protein n=1 Tax=Roseateles sp. L2-2 TaxID=3422597 RepID=UPI003D36A46D